MASKQVVNRQKSADSVIAVGETHADAVHTALSQLVEADLKKGQSAPDFASMILLACAALGRARDHMVEKDEAHEAELLDDAPVRAERDQAAAALREALVDLREIITGAYGPPATAKIFSSSAPEDPATLARFAGEVASTLSKVKLPAPRIKGAKLDTAEIAESLQARRAGLEDHLKAVQREVREAQASLDAKNTAVTTYDEVFAGVANTLSGLLRLAGKADLAAKVRPSTRRPGQTAEDAGDTAAPAAEPAEK